MRIPSHLRMHARRTPGVETQLPLSRLRPSGPEREEGADTTFVPPPPFSGEVNRGSWPGPQHGPASGG